MTTSPIARVRGWFDHEQCWPGECRITESPFFADLRLLLELYEAARKDPLPNYTIAAALAALEREEKVT